MANNKLKKVQVPCVFKNVIRRRYFEIFKIFVEDEDLILDVDNYSEDVLIDRKIKNYPAGIVAIIKSHSSWGEPDDLTNERIYRYYDGLEIEVNNENYRYHIEKIADMMKRNLDEDVIVKRNNVILVR